MQARLADQSQRTRGVRSRKTSTAPLTGLLFDCDGNRMSPTYAVKGGRRYRYYASTPLIRGTGKGIPASPRRMWNGS